MKERREERKMSLFAVPSITKRRFFLLLIDYLVLVSAFVSLALNSHLILRLVTYEDFWWLGTGFVYVMTGAVIFGWIYLLSYQNLGVLSKFATFILCVTILLLLSLPMLSFTYVPWNSAGLAIESGNLYTFVTLLAVSVEYLHRSFLLFPSIILLILVCIMFVPYISVFQPTQKKSA